MGQVRKDTMPITVTIPRGEVATLKALARVLDRPVSYLVSRAINHAVNTPDFFVGERRTQSTQSTIIEDAEGAA